MPLPISTLVRDHVWANAIHVLDIAPTHLDSLHVLPYHHKDPFDRIMVAQAIAEEMTLMARDSAFRAYDVRLVSS